MGPPARRGGRCVRRESAPATGSRHVPPPGGRRGTTGKGLPRRHTGVAHGNAARRADSACPGRDGGGCRAGAPRPGRPPRRGDPRSVRQDAAGRRAAVDRQVAGRGRTAADANTDTAVHGGLLCLLRPASSPGAIGASCLRGHLPRYPRSANRRRPTSWGRGWIVSLRGRGPAGPARAGPRPGTSAAPRAVAQGASGTLRGRAAGARRGHRTPERRARRGGGGAPARRRRSRARAVPGG